MTSGARLHICQDELPSALHFLGPSISFVSMASGIWLPSPFTGRQVQRTLCLANDLKLA
ncbi:unnamed protein product, partial [Larinioides sclopetarius]